MKITVEMFRSSEAASVILEFALVSLLLITTIMFLFCLGLACYQYSAMRYTTSQVIRTVRVNVLNARTASELIEETEESAREILRDGGLLDISDMTIRASVNNYGSTRCYLKLELSKPVWSFTGYSSHNLSSSREGLIIDECFICE